MSTQRTRTARRGALRQPSTPPLREVLTGPRIAALAALVAVAALAFLVLGGGDDRYLVKTELQNAGGLRKGFKVRIDGVPIGSVTKVDLGKGDVAIAEARIEDSAAPLGRDTRATVRAVNLLGEKYLDIEPGNADAPAESGAVIPASRTDNSIELDDLVDTLDPATRAALNVVLDEGGRSLRGRGGDLAKTVAAMPSALDKAGELLRQLSADNRALGRLIDESDRVVAAITPERVQLGRMITGAAETFDVLASRRAQLGATVREAPSTLRALNGALAALQDAAGPLSPAARGLRTTAPALTATLRALPPTAREATPALRAARDVAPSLDRLGTHGAPVARRLLPTARQLATFAGQAEPATGAIDASWNDILGVMEAWARATGPRDASGHIFRLAVGGGADLIEALARNAMPPAKKRRATSRPAPAPSKPVKDAAKPVLDKAKGLLPKVTGLDIPKPKVPDSVPAAKTVNDLLDFLLGP